VGEDVTHLGNGFLGVGNILVPAKLLFLAARDKGGYHTRP